LSRFLSLWLTVYPIVQLPSEISLQKFAYRNSKYQPFVQTHSLITVSMMFCSRYQSALVTSWVHQHFISASNRLTAALHHKHCKRMDWGRGC